MRVSPIWISSLALSAAVTWERSPAQTSAPDYAADSPVGLLRRFEAAYEARDLERYQDLFTSDFRFYPSDPSVALRYPRWTKEDEIASADHLFHGFTNDRGEYLPPATRIVLDLAPYEDRADPEHTDSTAYYRRCVVPSVTLQIWTARGDYFIERQEHDFFMVRGDAAVLEAGEVRSADVWYIRKWVEDPNRNLRMAAGDPDRLISEP